MYQIKKNKVYYDGELVPGLNHRNTVILNEYFAKDDKQAYWGAGVISGTDGATFEYFGVGEFYYDKHRVYYLGYVIPDADPDSFEVFHGSSSSALNYYAKDCKYAYHICLYQSIKIKKIKTKSVEIFTGHCEEFATDNEHVYWKGIKRKNSDPTTFQELGLGYWKDKNNVYYHAKTISEADPTTFISIGKNELATDQYNLFWSGHLYNEEKYEHQSKLTNCYSKRQKFNDYWWNLPDMGRSKEYGHNLGRGYGIHEGKVYWQDHLIKYADTDSFVALNDMYGKDKHYAYFCGSRLMKADPNTIEVLDDLFDSDDAPYEPGNLAKDKKHFYKFGTVNKIVDAKTYTLLNEHYSKDKNNVYYFIDTIIKGANPKTFKIIKNQYAKDNGKLYNHGHVYKTADALTFKLLNKHYAIDNKRVFFLDIGMEVIRGANVKTFKTIYEEYATDGNKLYWQGRYLKHIDVKSYRVFNSYYAKDKDHVYHHGDMIVKHAKPATFLIIKGAFGCDKSKLIGHGEWYKLIDAKSSKVLNDYYVKDKNHVYFGAKKIIRGANPKTFKIIESIHGMDDDKIIKSLHARDGDKLFTCGKRVKKINFDL